MFVKKCCPYLQCVTLNNINNINAVLLDYSGKTYVYVNTSGAKL